ncbi:hypothetical protein M758_UG079900 [Ceratodon purpureus]|nr:hypothetical protein M758_UG079900 [Ceratodon purpureus]
MDGWSPRTLVRYRFSREDENVNVISVWNWGELEEALEEIDSSDDDKDVLRLGTTDGVDTLVLPVDGSVVAVTRELESPTVEPPAPLQVQECVHGHVNGILSSNIEHRKDGHIEMYLETCPL